MRSSKACVRGVVAMGDNDGRSLLQTYIYIKNIENHVHGISCDTLPTTKQHSPWKEI